ncbi:BTB/POZ and TAZ domain-containing protein 4, partial [Aristolochia californica]|uniref:BTB/POZ and TAZ domain-containing protein 4 n=1 Tax=Aristolochia californica TaxID=171875 RepID=UPI0035DA7EA4
PPPTPGCAIRWKGFLQARWGQNNVPVATREMWDRLFKEGYRADVDIHTDSNDVIRAHASILGVASPVMRSMLKQSKAHSCIRSLSIRGVPHQAVHAFIRFLYSSSFDQEEMNKFALHLVVLSHVFMIPLLKKECAGHIENFFLTTENVIDVYQLAQLCDIPRLCLICHRMIISNFKVVSASEGWKVMKQSNARLEKELIESIIDADSKRRERVKKMHERKVYLQLHQAMEALIHICRDGCRTIGPHDKVLKGDEGPCNFAACNGLESLIRHFAGCKTRVPGGCIHCKRMWQLLELHSRLCRQPDICKVPLCRHFKEKIKKQTKKDEAKWRLLVFKVLAAKQTIGTSENHFQQWLPVVSKRGR